MKTLFCVLLVCVGYSIMASNGQTGFQDNAKNGSVSNLLNVCDLEPETGPCNAAFLRWYYDTQSGMCQTFVYGGCGGNANNYLTKSACEESCGSLCYLPADYGPCDGICYAFRFNASVGDCEVFEFGCCVGNANTFADYFECMEHCADVCDMPKIVGDCHAAIPRYYFNKNTRACELFSYGGCGGNDNNFTSLVECEAACSCQTDLVDDLLYTQQMTRTKSASHTLTSYSRVIEHSSLLYSASQSVSLKPTFKVELGSVLEVILEGCID